ncbi:hypothetical protein PSACC_03710 [Paramicrosporidium saccamoebae]|uniref:Fanconi-associated nuclease n=1 Tax=Paramicrosporidium saccamoebae TaxID=1246581 RepID=A0A2H9TFB0_9FUNG|nr:hypothetical protein PSACC_03710 [Paramicrosporidium saccamoebae]
MKLTCHKCGKVTEDSAFCALALLPCDSFLRYTCNECGEGETLARLHVTWVDVVHLLLYQLIEAHPSAHSIEGLKFFHWRSICDEIEQYWGLLWDRDRSGNWQTSVVAALSTYSGTRFQSGKELGRTLNGFWTLIDKVPPSEVEAVQTREADYEILPDGTLKPLQRASSRRKEAEQDNEASSQARRLRKQMRQLAASFVFSNLDFDRPNPPGPVSISRLPTHTAPELRIDQWNVGGDGGYRVARTTHGIDRGGRWYFEITFHTPQDGHVRVGLAQILAATQASVGYDEYGYAICSSDGASVHCGRPKPYAAPILSGAVIGVLLDIPSVEQPQFAEHLRAEIEEEYPPFKFGQYHVRQDILEQGSISFSVNGQQYGSAFKSIYHAKYYPAVSVYGGACVQLNLGPHFQYPPDNIQPVSVLESRVASMNTPHEKSESHIESHEFYESRELTQYEPSLSYYQKSLLAILTAVEDAYGNILLEEELGLVARIQRLEGDAQRMFFRLYLRKIGWFRVDRLEYKDIGNCPTAVSVLAEANLVEQMLDILQLEELRSLAKSLRLQLGSALNRERIRHEILATRRSKQKRLNFGPTRKSIADEATERIMELGRGLAGPVVRIPPMAIESLRRIFGLFFLDSTAQEENNLSTAIMTDLNRKRYPPYVLVKSGPVFSSRSDWIAYDEAIRYEKTVSEMLAGDETDDLLPDLLAAVLENWKSSYAAGQTVHSYFLRRYTAGWVYTRMLTSLVGFLEKAKNHKEANRILEILLGQDVYCLGYRGKWWERLVLNLATHVGGKTEALKKCQEALEDIHVRTGSRIALQRRLCKLTHTSFDLDEPPETVTLYADPETTRTTGRKLLYLSKQHVLVSVEDLVLEHFMDQGWRGFHCESRVYRMLFALCFWDILYGDTPDVFQTPYQTAPLDLSTDAFYRVRKTAIETRLTQIGEGAAPQLLVDSYYPFYGCQALGVLWEEYPLDALLDICHALGPALSPLLRVLAEDYGHSSAGLPDLLLYRPDRSAYRLVEVKSTNDRLSDAQRNWHAVFRQNQIDFVLFRVLDTHLQDR